MRPSIITLTKKEQKQVLSQFKSGIKGARRIADMLGLPRYQVMRFLEDHDFASYSEGSYN